VRDEYRWGVVTGLSIGATAAIVNTMLRPGATIEGLAFGLLVTAVGYAALPFAKRAAERYLRRRGVD
jgi:hypothetical protein